ncbi:MAG: intradiol ring-cleavage dioxygenase [Ignavibacteriaceae bacterium]|nr:hypothetical protein [Ignavibacteriaceae bacterium]NUM71520.1 intradiol ring-cleavage dioxygenase [Ignavibacteriaceae bacterium]
MHVKNSFLLLFFAAVSIYNGGCDMQSQNNNRISINTGSNEITGGGCEDCELMFAGMPETITEEHTGRGWVEGSRKLMLTGTVFKRDGRTPAKDVLIYYWHTDDNGVYIPDQNTPAEAERHGRLRGWIKTDETGRYTIRTSRPAAYPGESVPQHIHLSVKEPELKDPYYIDLYFDDDPFYIPHRKKYGRADRGGTEILRVVLDGNIQIAEHNIILGLNIPDYPKLPEDKIKSGLEIGEDQPSFIPYHAYGPNKGTRACPVCTYGRHHGILLFAGNKTDRNEIKAWLKFLEKESIERGEHLKVYFVFGNSENYDFSSRKKDLEELGEELGIKKTAITFVPSFDDTESEAYLNKINPDAENTIIIYKHRVIVDKYVNLSPVKENFELIREVLEKTRGEYFELPTPPHD